MHLHHLPVDERKRFEFGGPAEPLGETGVYQSQTNHQYADDAQMQGQVVHRGGFGLLKRYYFFNTNILTKGVIPKASATWKPASANALCHVLSEKKCRNPGP